MREEKAQGEPLKNGAAVPGKSSEEANRKASQAGFEETKSECIAAASSASTRLSEGEVDALIDGLESTRVYLSNILQADEASSMPE